MIPYMRLITIHLPRRWIKELDQLVAEKKYGNRSEAIRAAVRDLLADEVWRRFT